MGHYWKTKAFFRRLKTRFFTITNKLCEFFLLVEFEIISYKKKFFVGLKDKLMRANSLPPSFIF